MENYINVKEIRKTLGWSQEKFGASIGVDQTTVSRWENGEHPSKPAKTLISSMFLWPDNIERPDIFGPSPVDEKENTE